MACVDPTALEQIQKINIVGLETASADDVKKFPTTNVYLSYKDIAGEICQPQYDPIVQEAIRYGSQVGQNAAEKLELSVAYLTVLMGSEILKIMPGQICALINPRVANDKEGIIAATLAMISMYGEQGFDKRRVLATIPASWEGIQAAKVLQYDHDVLCNISQIFCLPQAIAAAESLVTFVNPLVGPILNWTVKNTETKCFSGDDDPGVKVVASIYSYYRKFDIKTKVMAGQFENLHEVKALVGCDILNVSPKILEEMGKCRKPLNEKLCPSKAKGMSCITKCPMDEKKFRSALSDKMVSETFGQAIKELECEFGNLEKLVKNKMKSDGCECPS